MTSPMDDKKYPSNSKSPAGKSEKTKVEKITKAVVVTREKPLLMKIFGGENAHGVGEYVIWDVLIPALKSTLNDIVSNGIELLLYGEPRSKNLRRDRGRTYVSYNSISRRDREERRERPTPRSRSRQNFDDIVIDTKSEAEEVLSKLIDLVDEYDTASVADFHELVDVPGEYTDNKWGWDNLSRASVDRVREGYILNLPRPKQLD